MYGAKRLKLGSTGALFALLFLSLSLSFAAPTQTQAQVGGTLADDLDAQIAVDWMTLLYDRIEAENVNAPNAGRLYAYAGITLYEAVLNGIPGNNSLAGQIDHMPDMPLPDFNKEYDWPTVANAALSTVYHGLFETGTRETHDAIEALRAEWTERRAEEVSNAILSRSIDYGDQIGDEILGWVDTDNYRETREMTYEIPTGGGALWVLTTPGTNPVEPYWGQIRPFGLTWADECAEPLNIEYSEDPDSAFYQQALEVKNVGDDLTPEQQEIARWWVDTPGISGTPAGHWVMIENQLVDQLELPLSRAAEMYAMVGIALGDSFISCWSLKYQYNLVRPVTYIRDHIRRSWAPYIETPPFPEYPSGHSVVSAAAADILTSLFGVQAFTDMTHVDEGMRPRTFTSFEAAAQEAAISRMYGGIHYRTAIENGMRQGRCVAEHLLYNIQLNPIRQGE